MAENNFNSLLQKLDEFTRKFYVNQIIRGVILFLSLSFILFLSIVILEYFGEFSSAIRTCLFFGFAILLLAVFSFLIAIPLLKIISIGKRISHEKASSIIGSHFSNVSDKLSNVLQLQQLSEGNSSELLLASINQKIEQLNPIPFAAAINFQENKKYLKFLLVPLLVIIALAAFQPKVIKDSTQRIISYNEEFVKKAPYQIIVENEKLTAFKNEDFKLKVSLSGEEVPNQLNVIFQGKRFLLSKKGKKNFEYEFKNLQNDLAFSLFDGEFESKLYTINTLEKPQHEDMRFEAIVANPPFSAKWSASPLFMSDDRFSAYGKLAPSSKADFAFVQHMVHQLSDNGSMACVLPHGVLFRGAAEGHIRKYLIEDRNYLDAVIGLPANIFYGTSIPTCILVMKKERANKDNILFIDASQHFEKVKTQNYLREEDINLIIDTYTNRTTTDKYSYVATLQEVAENDYNLNIPRYVDTFEEEEPVDLAAVAQELKAIDTDMATTDATIADYCNQLGIDTPF